MRRSRTGWWAGLIAAMILAGTLLAPMVYRRQVVAKSIALIGPAQSCRFEGHFTHSEVPVARLVAPEEPWIRPWADFYDRFLASEAAKPFHFGVIITDGPNEGAWGWSYWRSSFWRAEGNTFDLASRGLATKVCASRAR